jgi:hypothetical protein
MRGPLGWALTSGQNPQRRCANAPLRIVERPPHPNPLPRSGEREMQASQRRVFLVFPLQRDRRLFEIELALDAAAGFVGDLAQLQ